MVADAAAKPRVRVVAAALFDAEAPESSGAGRGEHPGPGPPAALATPGRRVLIAERPPGKHMAGRWEFPGGKVGPAETDLEALRRELREELGVEMIAARHCVTLTHAYPDRTIELSMWVVDRYRGEVRPLDGQRLKWVAVERLALEDILEADRPFIEVLQARGERPRASEEAPPAEESSSRSGLAEHS